MLLGTYTYMFMGYAFLAWRFGFGSLYYLIVAYGSL